MGATCVCDLSCPPLWDLFKLAFLIVFSSPDGETDMMDDTGDGGDRGSEDLGLSFVLSMLRPV